MALGSFRHQLSLCVVACIGCGVVGSYVPLTAFPAPVSGEVDPLLPEIKAAFESDTPGVKIVRLESGQRAFEIHKNELGITISRDAVVNAAIEVNGKCYWQPKLVSQASSPTGWGAIQVSQGSFVDTAYLNDKDAYKIEVISDTVGRGFPIDCGAVQTTGPIYRNCGPVTRGMCADPSSPAPAAPVPAPVAPAPAPAAPAAEPAAAAPSEASTPAPASSPQSGGTQGGLGELDPKAPAECRDFAQKMCNDPKRSGDAAKVACSTAVKTVNQVVRQSPAQAVDACKSLLKSLPPS